jgi:hypothetical protein
VISYPKEVGISKAAGLVLDHMPVVRPSLRAIWNRLLRTVMSR